MSDPILGDRIVSDRIVGHPIMNGRIVGDEILSDPIVNERGVNDVFAAADSVARLARMLERAAAPLSLADFRVLSSIESGEDRASRLARRLAVGKPAISATVDSLAKRGLVQRTKVEGDQRATALVITAEGAAEFALAKERLAARVHAVTDAARNPAASIRALAELGEAIDRVHAAREAAATVTA